ncbi:MAG: SoxR reducing system RseC family protein [Candidatus Glassbacteria bacterium]|nr:SoxR reducing system RseC family protein [Candidatus Glassbacteria bacterium]
MLSTSGTLATVEVNRSTMCEHCPEAGGCMPQQENSRLKLARASNSLGARPGDLVELSIDDGVILRGAFVIYLVPVIFLIVFVIGAEYLRVRLGWEEPEILVSGLAGILGLAVSLAVVRLLSTRWKYLADGRPEISRILPPEENGNQARTGVNPPGSDA